MVDLFPYQPQVGDIGLVRISGAVGVGIRLAEFLNGDGWAGDIEHAFGVAEIRLDGNGRHVMIVEAEPGGAKFRELHYQRVEWIPCPDRLRDAVGAEYKRQIGIGYSFLDYGACACHRLHLPVPGLREYIEDTGHAMCSQLVDQAAAAAGWHLFGKQAVPPSKEIWKGYVTPRMLRGLVPAELRLS